MNKNLHPLILCFLFGIAVLCTAHSIVATSPFEETKNLPIAYQGRFRSLDSASKLWLHDYYHKQQLARSDLTAFHTTETSALELLWKFHLLGPTPYNQAPLFWIHYAQVKQLFGFDPTIDRFSYHELSQALNQDKQVNLDVMRYLLSYEFAHNMMTTTRRAKNDKSELTTLSAGLWVTLRNDNLIIAHTPSTQPWHFLSPGMLLHPQVGEQLSLLDKQRKIPAEEIHRLFKAMQEYDTTSDDHTYNDALISAFEQLKKLNKTPQEIALTLEQHFPLAEGLKKAGSTLKLLPSKQQPGEWLSLHALKIKSYHPKTNQISLAKNFTTFSDVDFEHIRQTYLKLEAAAHNIYNQQQTSPSSEDLNRAIHDFVTTYKQAYASLANTSYKSAAGKQLQYPAVWQLTLETLYYQLPLIELTICAYFCALLLFLGAYTLKKSSLDRWALAILLLGFALHTAVLALRCFVLQRPPVSNMFETVIYVPWIALIVGLAFYLNSHKRLILCAACTTSLALLILLKITHIDARLENVQAVLDSQYWLIVHVLMVVGSYGAFAVCGILGHFYLFAYWKAKRETPAIQEIAQSILHTMYVGVALLIPGTILGGIWAAESWGRFWDWDPKESWAFISACIYLLVVHAYTFKRIHDFGLAVGAVGGLMAISFTWYGVNFVLGTGLHSYGFGKGGEGYYFLYLTAEALFLIITTLTLRNPQKSP